MDEHSNPAAPREVIESLDNSVRDVAAGRVHDALAVQAEARQMLGDQESARSAVPSPRRDKAVRRTRSTS